MLQAKGKLVGRRGLRLSYGQWYPAGEPKAVAVVVHGYGEHMGRYRHVVEALVARDYAVFAIDHRGHGESAGERACVERFEYFVDDLRLLVQEARDAHPALPLVMIGHSMGGLIATRYAQRYQAELAALVLSGAALQVGDGVSPLLKRVSGVLAKMVPTLPLLPAGVNVLSRDPEVDRLFREDPLCYTDKVKTRMGHEMMKASELARAQLAQLTLPLLLMHGEEDRLTNPAGSKLAYERARSTDKTLRLWPGHFHEIFNELEKEEVIAFMLEWMDARVGQPVAAATATEQVG